MDVFGMMGMMGFIFGLLGVSAFARVRGQEKKLKELEADLQSVKEELAKLRDQLGQGNATS